MRRSLSLYRYALSGGLGRMGDNKGLYQCTRLGQSQPTAKSRGYLCDDDCIRIVHKCSASGDDGGEFESMELRFGSASFASWVFSSSCP